MAPAPRRPRRPSPSLAVSVTALFVALGGGAYAATNDPFVLGGANSATTPSTLDAPVDAPALKITDSSAAANATALSLTVPAGRPPLSTNSSARVANLNADKLDGLDAAAFLRSAGPISLNVSSTTDAAVTGKNAGAGNGVFGTSAAAGASGVYGENTGGGF